MSNFNLNELKKIYGFKAAAVVDLKSGKTLQSEKLAVSDFDIDTASSGNANVVKVKQETAKNLKLDDDIEDILISLGKEYHLIRLLKNNTDLFIYLVLDRSEAQLGLARLDLKSFEAKSNFS